MPRAYLGLGSNLGDRRGYLDKARDAIGALSDTRIIAASSVLETDPVDFFDQPKFLNQVVLAETTLSANVLLVCLKDIEARLGRVKSALPKGPRVIDIDILLYDDLIINTTDLIIPHPQIKNRIFVMRHLVELDPDLADPVTKAKYADLLKDQL